MSDLGNREIFAKNLKYYMELHDKTRRDICDALNISYTTFASWESGVNYPRIDKIELLSNYFNVSKADLIEDKYKDNYYLNDTTAKMAQEIYDNPDYRLLFDASRKLSPEALKEVLKFIDYQKNKEGSD